MKIVRRFSLVVFALGLLLSAKAGGDSPVPALVEVDGYVKAGFEQLATFKITPSPFDAKAKPGSAGPSLSDQIPEAIRGLDGRKVIVSGFMLPIKMEGGRVTELLLMRSQMMCCYGVMPQVNEWVLVRMPKGVYQLMDVPVAVGGVLHVKALYENGFLTAIYTLDGERMLPVKG